MPHSTRKICKHCGVETDVKVNKCDGCGSNKFMPKPKPAAEAAPAKKLTKKHGIMIGAGAAAAVLVVGIIIGIVAIVSNLVASSTHAVNDEIETDWFMMTVVEAKIMRGSFGVLPDHVPAGHDRMFVDVILENHLDNENLDMHLLEDFYIQTSARKIYSLNIGGSFNIFDSLNDYGLFYGRFMVSPECTLRGLVVFDIPKNSKNVQFVYEEWHFKGDTRTKPKHRYKVNIPYDSPYIPDGVQADFEQKALAKGYLIEIENDYDGYNTHWIGAHRYVADDSQKNTTFRPDPDYTLDLTVDISLRNARVEFNLYVGEVKAVGGVSRSGEGSNWQYQINTSETQFGLAYQIDRVNFFVVADIRFKDEILDFLEDLGYGVRSWL